DFYKTGIMTINPPRVAAPLFDNPKNGPIYPTFIPKTDADGNDLAGIRVPELAVPFATYTGWALRGGAHSNDGCEHSGRMIPFARTKADRLASGDPRPSIEERYLSLSMFAARVKESIDNLVAKRLMLREDAEPTLVRIVNAARSVGLAN